MSDDFPESSVAVPATYPPALAKACEDSFDYALGLVGGEVIFFARAEPINETWVHLDDVTRGPTALRDDNQQATFDRGLDVRLDSIVWVADAPHGS